MKDLKSNLTFKKLVLSSLASVALFTGSVVLADQSIKRFPPKDPGVINIERITYWLKERGEIAKNADQKTIDKAVSLYTSSAAYNQLPFKYSVPKVRAKAHSINKNGERSKSTKIAVKTVKVLSVLVDFPDLPFDDNRLDENDTNMYYSSYTVEHYRDLMYSTTGFNGPSNQNLQSAYQFYQQETNNEFFLTGETFGWVTADSDSDVYGENDPENNDSDIGATELVKQAVEKAVAANSINLADYDLEDPFDLDGDGNLDEADGFIDHVNIFHSSIGEEAGGGVLAENAIWSHRFFVNATGSSTTMGYEIPGTGLKVFGYTIQPIDAAAGVVTHEFGHDLGLPDEYDIDNSVDGAPVGYWSLMASGSYGGGLSGDKPTTFSPYAREFLENRHGVNFMSQTTVDLNSLDGAPQSFDLVEATEHSMGTNQVKITLPNPQIAFGAPYSELYQYHSGQGHNLRNEMSFELVVPDSDNVTLQMKARWDIEQDWDYIQIRADGAALLGNMTIATNPQGPQYTQYADVTNYISGKSLDQPNPEGSLGWQTLTFDMVAYKGQTVTLSAYYYTDSNTGEYGFAFDDLTLLNGATSEYSDGAEVEGSVTLAGFKRISDTIDGEPQNYWVQLRSHNDNDAGLSARGYDPGVVLWFADQNYGDNKVDEHAGHGFIGVVDADQNLISTRSSQTQVRDAAFSLFSQTAYNQDNHLTNNTQFKDTNDYSSASKPAAGLILPALGLIMDVTQQSANSSTATIELSKGNIAVTANFTSALNERSVTFSNATTGGTLVYTYEWDFGDGSDISTSSSPIHVYATDGTYTVSMTATDNQAESSIASQQIIIDTAPISAYTTSANAEIVTFTNTSTGGVGTVTYAWDFGDGATSTDESPSHTFADDGSFEVTLTITDAESRTSSSTTTNVIDTAPSASFTSSTNFLVISFTNTSSGGRNGLSYSWDFGDGSTSTDQSPSHTYAATGNYSVVLTTTDGSGRAVTSTQAFNIQAQPEPVESSGGGAPSWLFVTLFGLLSLTRKRV